MILRFGILTRYVMGQVLRAFLMALVAITAIFSLFVVMAEATRQGLAPQEVVAVLPYLVPGSLTYTVPVALLFAVSVVYGRIAADNEVMAIKAAGLSVWTVLNPSLLLGLALSAALFALSSEVIPRANNAFRRIIFGSLEDGFFRYLKKERELNNPRLPFYIQVRDIRGRTLIEPLFKHRAASPPNPPGTFDLTVRARAATIDFDLENQIATVTLVDAETTGQSERPFLFWMNGRRVLQYPFPKPPDGPDKRVQEMTGRELVQAQLGLIDKITNERKRQAITAALEVAAGLIPKINWGNIREAHTQYGYWKQKYHEIETEKHVRIALAGSVLFFALLGAPVGILFAKRDFLSSFITCFIPIIVLYYPLVLAGINLGKEGVAPPSVVFAGDLLLGLIAGCFALPPVCKH
ncbi:MAG: permease [Isosphaeraceae bacterium]|jgi:lipopolysaccharide export system permease protein|nr:MAG: permease [Isosphaeraceae bacterium]